MGSPIRCGNVRKTNEAMRLIFTAFAGVVFGFFLGISFPTLALTKVNLPSSLLPSIDLTYIEDKYSSLSTQALLNAWSSFKGVKGNFTPATKSNDTKIWVPTNPRGAERLPPGIVEAQSDYYLRRLWGNPSEDLTIKSKYLVTFTVGVGQKKNIDAAVKKFSENFTVMLFHYDGQTTEWDEFEWSKRAIHVSVHKQTKWWYAKRFLHPDIVAAYDYIFIWDEDLGVEHFDAEEYLKLVRKHGLEISQPGLDPSRGFTWRMTKKRDNSEVHKVTEERPGWCTDPHLPPCASFVEIMATVFSRDAWRCVWYMIQNDLVHGWGLDFALRKCVEPAHEKIGVVDAQWIVHQGVPSLGNQGKAEDGKAPWEGVRERCRKEWTIFQDRLATAEKAYLDAAKLNERRLDESGDGVDSAIRSFNELYLKSVEVSDACNINSALEPNSQLETQVKMRMDGEYEPSEAQWDELIVSEVMSAFNRDDARARVLKALEALDQNKYIAASSEAAQNFQQENAMLKEENAALKENNIILSRGAVKQHNKHKDYEDKMTQQLHHLKQDLQTSKMENDDLKQEKDNLKKEIARLKQDQQNSFVCYRPIRDIC